MLEVCVINLGSFINKAQKKQLDGLQLFSLYFAARAFNAAKTIHAVTQEMQARELLGVARCIYECFLRSKYIRQNPSAVNDIIAQISVGNGRYEYKRRPDGGISKGKIVDTATGQEFKARFSFNELAHLTGIGAVHEEFYGFLSSVGHADVNEIGRYFNTQQGFFLSPEAVQAEVMVGTLIALAFLFDEMRQWDWAPGIAKRDARYVSKRLSKGFVRTQNDLGPFSQLSETIKELARLGSR